MNERYVFRGKHLSSGEWVAGHLVYGYNQPTIVSINSFFVAKTPETFLYGTVEDYSIDPATLGQCTGLHDKNGKSIFEGDVYKYLPKKADCYADFYIVEWCNRNYQFILKSINGDHVGMTLHALAFGGYFRHVGSIHDNPELLEVVK